MDNNNNLTGVRIKKLLDSRAESQNDLAEAIHVSKDTISKIITGKIRLTVEHGKNIADHFDTSLDYLYGRTEVHNFDTHVMEAICKHVSTYRKETNGRVVQLLSLSQAVSDYIGILNEIQLSEKMPKPLQKAWIDHQKKILLKDIQASSKQAKVDYHIIPFDIDPDEKDKLLEELSSSYEMR